VNEVRRQELRKAWPDFVTLYTVASSNVSI
jgi:hypothetical protein